VPRYGPVFRLVGRPLQVHLFCPEWGKGVARERQGKRVARHEFGAELIPDLYDCDPETINSRKKLDIFARRLCRRIKMKPYGKPLLEHFGRKDSLTSGFSLVQLIETSCISGHFSEGLNNAYLNIFSCKPFDPDDAAAFCKDYFRARRVRKRLLKRK
jgi:S-adenosylmethionine/arginine decarboxylase-like enzyme